MRNDGGYCQKTTDSLRLVFGLLAVSLDRASRFLTFGLPVFFLCGCATILRDQIESDINLASACQQIQANQAGYVEITKDGFFEMIKLRVLGNVASCGVMPNDGSDAFVPATSESVLYCGISEDLLHSVVVQKAELADFRAGLIKHASSIRGSIENIKARLRDIGTSWTDNTCRRVDTCAEYYSKLLSTAANRQAATAILGEFANLGKSIAEIQQLIATAEPAAIDKGDQDVIQLLADAKRYVSNARIFLADARRAILGDIALATRDAVINNIYYQFSHRTLDSLESSLTRVEKLLDKADDKVYGAISFGMTVGAKAVQDQLDKAYTDVLCLAQKGAQTRAVFALAQASCERFNDPARVQNTSYLAPFVERSFVKLAQLQFNLSSPEDSARKKGNAELDSIMTACAIAAAPSGASNQGAIPLRRNDSDWDRPLLASMENDIGWIGALARDDARQAQAQVAQQGQAEYGALPIYLAHEWAAGKVLTSVSPSEIIGDPDASGQSRRKIILVTTPPTRGEVQRLALASSSAVLTELQGGRSVNSTTPLVPERYYAPSVVKSITTSVNNAMSQSVSTRVGVATTQNVNVLPTVSVLPGNPQPQQIQNYIVLSRAQSRTEAFDLCDAMPAKVVCRRHSGGAYEVEAGGFDVGNYKDQDVRDLLRLVATTTKKAKIDFSAVVSGYASEKEFACAKIARWRGPSIQGASVLSAGLELSEAQNSTFILSYKSQADGGIFARSECRSDAKGMASDGNHALSFARAAWASSVLEELAGRAIWIENVIGFGAKYATKPDNVSDRRILVRLTPR